MQVSRHALACALAAALLSLGGPARAGDPDPAQRLFDTGSDQMDAGRFDQACPAIEESYRLDPRPGTLFTLAECEAKRGHVATAVKRFGDYLALHAALPPEKKRKQGDRESVARVQLATLGPLVPELTLVPPPAMPSGTAITVDGAPVAAAALGVPMRVDPGEHVIATRTAGGPLTTQRVTLLKGGKTAIALHVADTPAASSGRRSAVYATGAVGLAGLVLGAVAGGMALGKKSTVDGNCGLGGVPEVCNHTGKTAADALKTFGLVSTIGFGVGLAAAGTSVILFVTEPRDPPAGSSGAVAGLRGTW